MKAGTIIETSKWKIKVYAPPREHGAPHVHVQSKVSKAQLKVFLETLEVVGNTQFSKRSVKLILKYIHKNYDILMDAWEELHG
ncbi:MAG: DUF4160 domain-containing protein [Bacteriovoracaceae bacterium]|nr:DUF4160 domain-containing protein [Bacteriovoracaceae bacterium]